jgi:type IV pilus assembly protein PilO
MSADQVSRPKAVVKNVRQRTRGWLNAVNLHWAGVGVLALVCVYLLVQMGIAWNVANSQNAEALQDQQLQLKTAEIAARPLEGLDVKLAKAGEQADKFYLDRLPVSYSEIATELGKLKNSSKVRLTRLQYAQSAAGATPGSGKATTQPAPDGQLTEVRLDAGLTGDYRPLVTFINSLERDKVFFLINGITLTGQQTGVVSLRIRMTTYLRGLVPQEEMEKAEGVAPGSPLADADKAVEKAAGGSR